MSVVCSCYNNENTKPTSSSVCYDKNLKRILQLIVSSESHVLSNRWSGHYGPDRCEYTFILLYCVSIRIKPLHCRQS